MYQYQYHYQYQYQYQSAHWNIYEPYCSERNNLFSNISVNWEHPLLDVCRCVWPCADGTLCATAVKPMIKIYAEITGSDYKKAIAFWKSMEISVGNHSNTCYCVIHSQQSFMIGSLWIYLETRCTLLICRISLLFKFICTIFRFTVLQMNVFVSISLRNIPYPWMDAYINYAPNNCCNVKFHTDNSNVSMHDVFF